MEKKYVKCKCCGYEFEKKNYYEPGGEENPNFDGNCIDCKHNEQEDGKMPCLACTMED